MEMNFDQLFIAHGQQAVPLKILREIIVDGVFIQPGSLYQQLGVIPEFQHTAASFSKIYK